jgi:hypothetical protein
MTIEFAGGNFFGNTVVYNAAATASNQCVYLGGLTNGTQAVTFTTPTNYAWYDPNATCGNVQYVYQYPSSSFQYQPIANSFGSYYEETEEQKKYREVEEQKRAAAEAKAEELLVMCLNETQRKLYLKESYLEVNTDIAKYRIKKGWSKNVEKLREDGTPELVYCIHPGILIPTADNMLAQKLMLENNEKEFLRLANKWAV